MNVVVRFHESVRQDLERWLTGDDEERRALVRLYVDELIRRFEVSNGIPPEAVCIGRSIPPTYQMRYTGEAIVRFQVRNRPGTILTPGAVKVVVTQIRLVSAE